MNKTIHIAQFAAGSRYDNIGDTTLFYSEGFSKRANDVSGIFLDNPPMLSSRHASLVWRYYKDVDRYILIHVQGSHVVSSAMGRNYPFRAGYEVSRDDMNAIDFSLTSLFAVMPRIENMPKGRTEAQRDIACGHPYLSRQAEALAGQLINALIRGQRLYLSMPVPDEDYRCDGIFNAPELTVLLTAIESLPLQLRRYATFGFCIDDRFSFVLDDVLLMVYDEDSKINIPSNAIAMSWEKAVTTPPVVDAVSLNALQAVKLPGANGPLLSLDALRQAVDVARKSPADLTAAEWPIWIALGRQFGELQVTGWPQFAAYYQRMDAQTREQWVAYCRKTSIGWPLNGFSEPLLGVMRYGDDEHRQIQRAALPAFLLEGGYSFLFKEGLTSELKENLDANLLAANTKNPTPESIRKWYEIYSNNKRLGATGVQTLFKDLFSRHVAPQLKNLSDIVSLMEACPFIPASAFSCPAKVYKPKNIQRLAPHHRQLVEQWIRKAVDATSFTSINEVVSLLAKANMKNAPDDVEMLSLREIKPKALKELLLQRKGEDTLAACEAVLAQASKLPKQWHDFVVQKVLPAANDVLFSADGLLPREVLLDTAQWSRLGPLKKRCPHVFVLLSERLSQLFSTSPYTETAATVKRMRSEGALPIIEIFINSLKKRNKNMANDLEKQYKALRKKSSRFSLKLIAALACGLIVGSVLTLGGMGLYKLLSGSETAEQTGGTSIHWADNGQGNLMVRLADIADWDNISEVKIDTFSLKNFSFPKTTDLLLLNQRYYTSATTPKAEPAKAVVYMVNEKGQQTTPPVTDTLTFASDHSLLSTVCSRDCRIGSIMVDDSIVVDIPNKELMGNDSTALTTKDSRYYLRVVKYVQSKLPAGTIIAY